MQVKAILSVLFVAFLGAAVNATSTAFSRGISHSAVFGVPRGGGLFGGKDKEGDEEVVADGGEASSDPLADVPKYPPMTKEEIEEWLDHIPVFAVTDSQGQGVVVRPENDTGVFFFFMSHLMANTTLTQLQQSPGGEGMDLKVSTFSLGKIWFRVLNPEDGEGEVMLKKPGSDEAQATTGVEYRLVPDTRDLLGARMLLTMNPEDGEKLKNGEAMTPEVAQAAIKKAMTESPKFNSTFNEIPVFLIAQMRMQKAPEEDEEEGESVTLMPMYFSLQNMVNTWQQFMAQAPPDMQGVEPAINLMALHDLVEMMQTESPIDFRNVVLVPSTLPNSTASGDGLQPAAADPMSQMGGSTLGDL